MTIKALVYIEKSTFEYSNILNSLNKISNLEINNFVYSENNLINIEGLTQLHGSLSSVLSQLKFETVLTFGLSQIFIETITKLQSLDIRLYVILIPLCINMEHLPALSGIPIYTCLPLRHVNRVWKAHTSLSKGNCVLQYIESSLIAPTLSSRHKSYSSQMNIDINHFYRLTMVDVIQFICSRTLFKVQALNRVLEWEMREEHKNEKHLDDYSVIIGYFLPKEGDVKSSLTSKSGSTMLNPRTGLIKIQSYVDCEEVSLNLKIKTTNEVIKMKDSKMEIDGKVIKGDNKIKEWRKESFWDSKLVLEGIEMFLRHVEYVRQQNAPRLVDLGTLSEDDMLVAKTSLISLPELVRLCHVITSIDRASISGQTAIVE